MSEEYLHDALSDAQEDVRDMLERITNMESAHAAEVERLTGERDSAVRERDALERELTTTARARDCCIRLRDEAVRGGVVEALRRLVLSVDDLVADSHGVAGLHLNGDVAPWEELLQGGRYEEWLMALEEARAALAKIGGQG